MLGQLRCEILPNTQCRHLPVFAAAADHAVLQGQHGELQQRAYWAAESCSGEPVPGFTLFSPSLPSYFFFNSESPQSALTYSSAADNGKQLFVAVISIARESWLLAASPEGRSQEKQCPLKDPASITFTKQRLACQRLYLFIFKQDAVTAVATVHYFVVIKASHCCY